MGADRILRTKSILDDSQFKKGLQESQVATQAFASQMKRLGGMIAGAFAVGAIIRFMKSSFEASQKSEMAFTKVKTAVEATGMAAGFTADQLKMVAQALSMETAYKVSDILNEVTAQLLSFPKIVGYNFLRTQEAVMDLATLLDGDLQSAAIQVGKAMQDPVKGMNAMRRSGIMFSAEQSALIKKLAEEDRLWEAQTIMLNEINVQYGNQAKELAKLPIKQVEKMEQAVGALKKTFGATYAPIVGWFAENMKNMINSANQIAKSFEFSLKEVGNYFLSIRVPILGAIKMVKRFGEAYREVARDEVRKTDLTRLIKEDANDVAFLTNKFISQGVPAYEALGRAQNAIRLQLNRGLGFAETEEEAEDFRTRIAALTNNYSAFGDVSKMTIKQLKDNIKSLEEEMDEAETDEDIKRVREQIEKLQETLEKKEDPEAYFEKLSEAAKKAKENIEDFVKAIGTGPFSTTPSISNLPSITENMPTPEQKTPNVYANNGQLMVEGQPQTIFDLATEGAKDLDLQLRTTYEGLQTFSEKYEPWSKQMVDISDIIAQAFQGLAQILSEAISMIVTALISGSADMADVMNGIMQMIGGFLKSMGEALMAYGVAKMAAQLMANVSGGVAIAAGLALVIAGTVLQSAFAKPVKMALGGIVPEGFPGDTYPAMLSSGETILPAPHKLSNMFSDKIALTGEFKIKGSDLVYIVDKQNSKLDRYR